VDPRHAPQRLTVRPSAIHRYGVYSEEFIRRGRKVIEYTGEKISRAETKRRSDGKLNYLFTLDAYWTIDGSVGGSGAEFINHSCEPNCVARIVKGHILYLAARDIHPGEELTVDYRFEAEVDDVLCSCGSNGCRGTINLKRHPKKSAAPAKSRLRKKPSPRH
jgi:SET domain-containing protein